MDIAEKDIQNPYNVYSVTAHLMSPLAPHFRIVRSLLKKGRGRGRGKNQEKSLP